METTEFLKILERYIVFAFDNYEKMLNDLDIQYPDICEVEGIHMAKSTVKITLNVYPEKNNHDYFIETSKFIDWCNGLYD